MIKWWWYSIRLTVSARPLSDWQFYGRIVSGPSNAAASHTPILTFCGWGVLRIVTRVHWIEDRFPDDFLKLNGVLGFLLDQIVDTLWWGISWPWEVDQIFESWQICPVWLSWSPYICDYSILVCSAIVVLYNRPGLCLMHLCRYC